ncbi:MAG: diguanylate cyclase [Pseudomonadota bacterium]
MTSRWRAIAASALDSLKLRVTLGVAAALVLGMGAITAALVGRAEHDTLRAQHQRELNDAARTADLLSGNVTGLQRDLQSVAAQLDPALLANERELDRFIRDKPVLREHFANVFVLDRYGRARLVADANGIRHPDLDVSDRPYFRQTLAQGRPVVSEPIVARLNGAPLVILTYPVFGPGGVVAVIGGSLELASRDLLAEQVRHQESDVDALTVLTDATGVILAHPDRNRLLRPIAEEPRLAEAFAAWVAMGRPMEPSGLTLPQSGEVVSAAGAAAPNWIVWRARAESELLAPLRIARRAALGWAAGLIALTSLGVFALLRSELRPLVLLERRAQHLFDGRPDADTAWPQARGEIGRLQRVLHHVGAERAQLEAFNAQVLLKLGSVMSAAPIGIAFTRDRRFELVSAEFCRLFGRAEHEFLGQPAQMIYTSEDEYQRLGALVSEAFGAGHSFVQELQMLRADGSTFWASLRGNPVATGDPAAGTIWSVADVTEQHAQTEQLAWSATHDPLTGLANRKLFLQRAGAVLAAAPLSMPATLVMIDLDRFKPINDTAGHAAGDAMLRAVAAALGTTVRATDLVVRLGGDEFALLLERCPEAAGMRIAEAVREAIHAISLPWEGRTLRIGASLGVSCLSPGMTTVDEWVDAADAACYAAKNAGRGMVHAGLPAPAIAVAHG